MVTTHNGIHNNLTFSNGEGHSDDAVATRDAVKAADKVGEIVEDGEVVLDDDDVALGAREAANRPSGAETLFHVQVRRRLVEHEDVGVLDADNGAGESLTERRGGEGKKERRKKKKERKKERKRERSPVSQ